ncbi:MAG TPA: ATP-binding cassette domain-containing protein [Streptosporangiaceae bacterium]
MRLKHVAFRYTRGGPWVLRDATLELAPGRILEFRGANGAGKSTLLRLVAGLLRPRRGDIEGRPARVGYAAERFPSGQPFTVAAYLSFMAGMRRLPATAAEPWVERLGLGPLLDVPLPELSKGSAHKVGLVHALSSGAGLLVLDEPFAGLDAPTRADLPAALTELAAAGATIVVSDHQGCLDGLPDIERYRIDDHTISGPLPHGRRRAPEEAEITEVTLEVVVPADEADAVAAKLRADGHRVRRADR